MVMNVRGFTLVELLVVLAIIATLLTLASPRFMGGVDKAKEAVLKEDLATLREAIEKFAGDTGKYPGTVDDLVSKHYLRRIPVDPVTNSDATWVIVPPVDPRLGAVFDVKSGAQGIGHDGTPYRDW
jgi:general secretion pathway protein G